MIRLCSKPQSGPPVIFRLESDEHDIARVLKMVVNRGALDAPPGEYQAAILKVLDGRVQPSVPSDDERPDCTTRRFLLAVLGQMERDAGSSR
jgi:hypothetical protein